MFVSEIKWKTGMWLQCSDLTTNKITKCLPLKQYHYTVIKLSVGIHLQYNISRNTKRSLINFQSWFFFGNNDKSAFFWLSGLRLRLLWLRSGFKSPCKQFIFNSFWILSAVDAIGLLLLIWASQDKRIYFQFPFFQ